uniref:Late embryogenesis abundant protein LEA-2 subgroup domain-containing protein n=1 Tax=Arundo donax TaxID=35708 RepID=A0A0A9HHY5_ARUDO
MAADNAAGGKSTFRRLLDASRYALAAAVTVLIVTVVVYSIILVARPEQLAISVSGGFVSVERDPPAGINLAFTPLANNPSGRVRFYFTDIYARLLVGNGSKTFARFHIDNMAVAQDLLLQSDVRAFVDNDTSREPYFDILYN